ncbi:MAG: hypothetical protein AB1608_01585 [Thermoproteota archaeon]
MVDKIYVTIKLLREPDSFIDRAKNEREKREKEVAGLCKVIGIDVIGDKFTGSFGDLSAITRAWTIARDAYIVGLMDVCILFSSIAVECAINNDQRMTNAKNKQLELQKERKLPDASDWLLLNPHTLRQAKPEKLPIQALLDPDESIGPDKELPKFIRRRNIVAHGSYQDYSSDVGKRLLKHDVKLTQVWVDVPPAEALDQFKKCSAFLTEWVNQQPKMKDFQLMDFDGLKTS